MRSPAGGGHVPNRAAHAGRRVVVLASGDPMFHGIGRALAEVLGPGAVQVLPHPSSVSYACARLGWPVEDVEVVSLVGRPTARLASALHDSRRLLVLSAGAATSGEIAALLRDRGFGTSRMRGWAFAGVVCFLVDRREHVG